MVAALFATSTLVGCIGQSSASRPPRAQSASEQLALEVKWLPPCRFSDQSPYFSISLHSNGVLQYWGGPEAKERGAHEERISRAQLQQLRQTARTAIAAASRSRSAPSGAANGDLAYCLEFAVHDDQGVQTGRISSDAKWAKDAVTALHNVVRAERWVCPPRRIEELNSQLLRSRSFCSASEKALIARFIFAGEGTCASYHAVRVHADGVVYYAVVDAALSGSQTIYDQYFELPPDGLAELLAEIRRSSLGHSTMDVESLTKGPLTYTDPDFSGGQSEDMTRLKSSVERIVGLRWADLKASVPACKYRGPSSYVWLRADYGRKSSKR
jgi:hypothetical protein